MSESAARLNEALGDRYHVERELGAGGMATVYLAEDLKHKRKVALKVLKPALAAVVGAERFLAEIETTANLQHPHILPLFDSGEADSFLFYVMPYIRGESLRERLDREKQLAVDEAVTFARKVADALDYAHEQGVVHRDIKPANILLSQRGEPLVADFGIALAVTQAGGGRITETGLSLGTPHYMSPEQAAGDRDVDARSDVYALGCVLYETLAGQSPFAAPTAQAVLARILTEDPRDVRELRRSVPEHVAAVISRALEKLPADRFQDAASLKAALDDPGFTHIVVPRTATAPGPVVPSTAARRRSPLAASVPWVLAAGFAGVAAWLALDAPEPMPVTRSALELQGLQPMDFVATPAVAQDGSAFAFNHRVDGESRIAVRRASERDFRTLAGAGSGSGLGSAFGPVFSPDGEWIAYLAQTRGLMKIATSGGPPQPIVPGGGFMVALDWAEDGSILYLDGSRNPNELRVVPNTGGESEVVYEARAMSGQILPGGNVVIGSSQDPEIRFVDVARDTSWVVVPAGVHPRFVNGYLLWVDDSGAVWASRFDPVTGVLDEGRGIVLEGVTIAQGGVARYDVSENGTLVYSTGGSSAADPSDNRRLVTVWLDGSIVAETLDPRNMEDPVWSPEGRYIAYRGREPGVESDDTQIYRYDMQVKDRPRPLTREGSNRNPVWSPDGTRIAFASRRDGSLDWDVYVKDVEGDAPATRLLGLEGIQAPADWISDEQMIIEHSIEPWILDLPGPGDADSVVARPFFESEDLNYSASLPPQRDFMAYASNATGQTEVYVRSFPVSEAPQQISEGGGFSPQWSADGNAIYYFRRVDDSNHLWAARIDRGPPLAVTSLDSLMAWPEGAATTVDLHPDGDRFITTRPDAAPGSIGGGRERARQVRYFVVTNWFEEMRARLGGG